jgi:hypothetical protein
MYPMSGGISLSLDEPSREQKEAEAKARSIVFGLKPSVTSIYKTLTDSYTQKEGELIESIRKRNEGKGPLAIQTLFPPNQTEEEKEFYRKKEEDIQRQLELAMLQSPMFATMDGFTAMNDTPDICVGAECSSNALQSMTGQTNPEDSRLDDFFPEPLQPFSF